VPTRSPTSLPESLDPFELFGVDPASASEAALTRAYRELESQYGEDEAPATHERIKQAYQSALRRLQHRAIYTDALLDGAHGSTPEFSPPPLQEHSEGAHAMASAEQEAARLLGDEATQFLAEFEADIEDDAGDTDIDIPATDPETADALEALLDSGDEQRANRELVDRLVRGAPVAAAVVVNFRGPRLQVIGAARELSWGRLRAQKHRWAAVEIFEAGLIELLMNGRPRDVIDRLDTQDLASDLPDDKALQQVVLQTLCALAWRARRPATRLLPRLFGDLPDDLGDQRQHLVDRFRAVCRLSDRWAEARAAGNCPRELADFVELGPLVNGPAVQTLADALRVSLDDQCAPVWATICRVADTDRELLAFLTHELSQLVGPELRLETALTQPAAAALMEIDRASRPRPWSGVRRLLDREGPSPLDRDIARLAPVVFDSGLGPDNIANWAQTRGAATGLSRLAKELRTDARLSLLGAIARARLGLQRPGAARPTSA